MRDLMQHTGIPMAVALVVTLALTPSPATASRTAKGYYTSLTGSIDYVQQVNSSGKSSDASDLYTSFHDEQHTMHLSVNALYSEAHDGYLGTVTETVSDHSGNLAVRKRQDECHNVVHNYTLKDGTDDLDTGKYSGHAAVQLEIMDRGHDFAHPVFDDPYNIQLEFATDSFGGMSRMKDIDTDDDPCNSTHDRGSTNTYPTPELHANIDIQGHPDKHPKSARTLTGKIITIDDVPSSEKGTATTTVTWHLRYCEMVSDLAPLAPMNC